MTTQSSTSTECPRTGQTVAFIRCGIPETATIQGWDYVSGRRGAMRGDELADPRYYALAGTFPMAVTESNILAVIG